MIKYLNKSNIEILCQGSTYFFQNNDQNYCLFNNTYKSNL